MLSPSTQYGFQRGLSIVTQLVEITHFFSDVFNKREQANAIFLHFVKASDCVLHPKLLFELKHLLRNVRVPAWLSDYLTNWLQYMQINGSKSSHAHFFLEFPKALF